MRSESFSHHEPCPKCNSRDNVGVWSDGHKFCFGCHVYIPGDQDKIASFKSKLTEVNNKEEKQVSLPEDCVFNLPIFAKEWILKYLTEDQIIDNKIQWSDTEGGIVLPIFDLEMNLQSYQVRTFNNPKAKYISRGNKEYPCMFLQDCDIVCVVEDYISACKIGSDVVASMALLGSYLSLARATELSRGFKHMVLWLDADKTDMSVKFQTAYRNMFDGNVSVIFTPQDPKEYSLNEITERIFEAVQETS